MGEPWVPQGFDVLPAELVKSKKRPFRRFYFFELHGAKRSFALGFEKQSGAPIQ